MIPKPTAARGRNPSCEAESYLYLQSIKHKQTDEITNIHPVSLYAIKISSYLEVYLALKSALSSREDLWQLNGCMI